MSQKFKPLSRSFHLWSGLIKVIVAKNLLNICRLLISNSQRCQLVERNLALFLFCSLTSTNRFANCMRRFLCAQYFTIKLPPLLLFDFVFLVITLHMSNSQLNISKDSFFFASPTSSQHSTSIWELSVATNCERKIGFICGRSIDHVKNLFRSKFTTGRSKQHKHCSLLLSSTPC